MKKQEITLRMAIAAVKTLKRAGYTYDGKHWNAPLDSDFERVKAVRDAYIENLQNRQALEHKPP